MQPHAAPSAAKLESPPLRRAKGLRRQPAVARLLRNLPKCDFAEISTVILIWGPGSQARKIPGLGGGAGPEPGISLAWSPAQGPKQRNTKYQRGIQRAKQPRGAARTDLVAEMHVRPARASKRCAILCFHLFLIFCGGVVRPMVAPKGGPTTL